MIYSSILLNNSLKESIMFITEGPLFILEDAIPHITENIIVGNTALFSIIVIKLLGNKFVIMSDILNLVNSPCHDIISYLYDEAGFKIATIIEVNTKVDINIIVKIRIVFNKRCVFVFNFIEL